MKTHKNYKYDNFILPDDKFYIYTNFWIVNNKSYKILNNQMIDDSRKRNYYNKVEIQNKSLKHGTFYGPFDSVFTAKFHLYNMFFSTIKAYLKFNEERYLKVKDREYKNNSWEDIRLCEEYRAKSGEVKKLATWMNKEADKHPEYFV